MRSISRYDMVPTYGGMIVISDDCLLLFVVCCLERWTKVFGDCEIVRVAIQKLVAILYSNLIYLL